MGMSGFARMLETALPSIVTSMTGKSMDDVKREAMSFWQRFQKMEQVVKDFGEDRIVALEARISYLEEYLSTNDPDAERVGGTPTVALLEHASEPTTSVKPDDQT